MSRGRAKLTGSLVNMTSSLIPHLLIHPLPNVGICLPNLQPFFPRCAGYLRRFKKLSL